MLAARLALAGFALLAARPLQAEIPVVELDGVVHAVSAAHVVSAIDRADAAGAPLLVLRLNTPGGYDTAMRQVVDRMLSARTPIAAFVAPSGARAASAGFVIALAADVAAMAPGTNMGAAHPVGGGAETDDVMRQKVTADAAAYVRSKAERRGRPVEWAEKAVTESRSYTEREAVEHGLADLVANDLTALLTALEGREVRRFDGGRVTLRVAGHALATERMTWRQEVLATIARPEILFLLLLGALAGLGTEISHPGLLFPGVVGALCLVLFLFASQIVPINGAGVALVLLAIALFAAEVKVTSYGLLTVGGLVSMILGAMMLIDAPVPDMRVPLGTIVPAALAFAAGAFALVRLVVQAQRRVPVTGEQGLIGQHGVAETDVAPEGWVRVAGERWRALAEGGVSAGDRVVVAGLDGLTLHVRKEA